MPEVKGKKNKKRVNKSGAQINGNSSNGSSMKIDTTNKIKEEEAKVLELQLIGKDLTSISGNLFYRYCNLLKLNLSDNKLSSLPDALKCLVNLETLVLDNNKFSKFPLVLEGLGSLKELSFMNNKLRDFPGSSVGLLTVEKLNLSGNDINMMPVTWKEMTRLKILDLSGNYLKFIPTCIEQGMPKLEMIDLSDNRMDMDGEIYSHRIKKFYGRNNKNIRLHFPRWIFSGKYYKFEELDFENSTFDIIMIPLNPKIRVKVLNLQHCNFTSKNIEGIMSDIESVECLKIGNNHYSYDGNLFPELPLECINAPNDILEFKCQSVGLSTISPAIKNFTNVTKLDFSQNHISWLPDEFCSLKKLEILFLAQNSLIMLPGNIGSLENLRVLDIAGNNITSLPESLIKLKNLQYLDIYYNDLRELPENMKDFENLVGFDAERNFVDTDNCQLAMYENLRDTLRAYNNTELRGNGPKTEPPYNSSKSSFSSSQDSNDSFSDVSTPISQVYSVNNEDWDKEYDSSDDFDAYNPPPIIEKEYFQTRYMVGNPMYFCPADLHAPRIKDVIAENYARGKYPSRPPIVEGQFDDAD